MLDTRTIQAQQRPTRTLWLIGTFASLIGFGQNALLVSLPILVMTTDIDLGTWSILIAIGSVLFLPSAPFWGKQSDKSGPRKVVSIGLLGLAVTFIGFALIIHALEQSWISTTTSILLLGTLRIIYGLTVSGLVPASQHWAIQTVGKENRLSAITSVSAALSVGRIGGPLLSVALVKLNPLLPFAFVGSSALFLVTLCLLQPSIPSTVSPKKIKSRALLGSIKNYITIGLCLCAAVGVLHYSLTPLLQSIPELTPEQWSDWVGYLLTTSAVATLLTQLFVVKKKLFSVNQMLTLGATLTLIGYGLFLVPSITTYLIAIIVLSSGNAVMAPAYTAKAMQHHSENQGQISGLIATGHTIGFGLAGLIMSLSAYLDVAPIGFSILLAGLMILLTFRQLKT